jgi:hypothetical protein
MYLRISGSFFTSAKNNYVRKWQKIYGSPIANPHIVPYADIPQIYENI